VKMDKKSKEKNSMNAWHIPKCKIP
jgi:hypothetical protein